jgi:alpha-ketoglutarate-dependent taurine dioxygenase
VADDGVKQVADEIAVVPLSTALGAEVVGADLSTAANGEYAVIRTAFLQHHLLVFRKQSISDEDIVRFAAFFGEIEINQVRDVAGAVLPAVHSISNVDDQGRPSANPLLKTNYSWHSDKSYLSRPSLMTMLYGLEVPPTGGDTEFSNMEWAYDDLPDEMKQRLSALRVIQSFDYMLENMWRPAIISAQDIPPPVEHPLVRTHPDTGRKSLFVGMYSESIASMPEAEGRHLIAELLAHATQEKYRFTQKWQPRDFVAWDNRSLIHRAIPNYEMGAHRRVMRRCVVRGSVPR